MEKFLFLFTALILSTGSYAQSGPFHIKGKVIDDQTHESIPGANIAVPGAKGIGTSTNFNGDFAITLPEGKTNIQVSFMGYFTQNIPITASNDSLVISLKPDEEMLKDVVVLSCFKYYPSKSRTSKSAKHVIQNGCRHTYSSGETSKFASAPLIRLRGQVIDEMTGETIPGVNLTVKKSKKSTSTNFDGLFSLDSLRLGDILTIEFVGYLSQKIPIPASNDSLIIRMKINKNMLHDIIEI